jgi:DNA-binding NtrC family response regulator
VTASHPAAILIVDDERDMAESCQFLLERAGHQTMVAFSGEEALDRLDKNRFDLVVTDLKMPRMTGLALLTAVKSRDPDVEVLIITGFPGIDTAVAAIKQGAYDYLSKPFSEQALLERVDKALAHRALKQGNAMLLARLREGTATHHLVYKSKAFGAVVEMLERAARTEASVLIQGESGTGKEVLAHHLHDLSPRAGRPFVPVDCATIPSELFESEIFGHKKGAFSGATANKAGLFEIADGGTLFLDEVGELPAHFQPKLLRAIQERAIRRVGETDYRKIDVRIVAATNRNLSADVEAQRFRQDLYYRLDVVRIDVPPLRVRPDDIEPLAEHFRARFCAQNPGHATAFADEALVALRAFSWPGNVRQLRNAVERSCALCMREAIGVEDLPVEVRGEATELVGGEEGLPGTFQEMKARKVAAIESSYVARLLEKNKGNVTRSADEAGVSRSAFQKLMQRYGIKSSEYR